MTQWTEDQARSALDLLRDLGRDPSSAALLQSARTLETTLGIGPVIEPNGSLTRAGKHAKKRLEDYLAAVHGLATLGSDVPLHSLPRNVLVIGSAHLDVLCDFEEENRAEIDKPGVISITAGGCAFNIAANLARHHVPVSLFTCLGAHSIAADMIERQCVRLGVNTQFISRSWMEDDDSAFVAHRCRHDLVSAVTSTIIDRFVIDEEQLREAVDSARFVVAECNLSAEQLELVVEVARELGRSVVVAGVSESKARRVLSVARAAGQESCIELFALNEREAEAVFGKAFSTMKPQKVCSLAGSANVLVTRGARGYTVFTAGGQTLQFSAPSVPKVAAVTGAGDALVAGVCSCFLEDGVLAWEEISERVGQITAEVLAISASTIQMREPISLGGALR